MRNLKKVDDQDSAGSAQHNSNKKMTTSVVRARLGLEAAALARLAGLTACQNRKPGPEPSQAEPSPSRGLSPGLGRFGTTVLKN